MKYFQDKSGGAAFVLPGLIKPTDSSFEPQIDKTEVKESEKYILAGHGSISQTKKFTIVPNNVTIYVTVPRGTPHVSEKPSEFIGKMETNLIEKSERSDFIAEEIDSNIQSIIASWQLRGTPGTQAKIYKQKQKNIYMIKKSNNDSESDMIFFEIISNKWIEQNLRRVEKKDFFLFKSVMLLGIRDTKLIYKEISESIDFNDINKMIQRKPDSRYYYPGSVIQDQIFDFDLTYSSDNFYKDTWNYSGLFFIDKLIERSEKNKKTLDEYKKSLDKLDDTEEQIYNGINNPNYIYKSKLPGDEDEMLSLNELSLEKLEIKYDALNEPYYLLSDIFKLINSDEAFRDKKLEIYLSSCRGCSKTKDLILETCNPEQIQEQQIDEDSFLVRRTYSSPSPGVDRVTRTRSARILQNQYDDSLKQETYLDLNELYFLKNNKESIINYMIENNLLGAALTKKAENILEFGVGVYRENVLIKRNLPKPGEKFTIIGTEKEALNFQEVTILGQENWKSGKSNVDRIAVKLQNGRDILLRPRNLSPIVIGTIGELIDLKRAELNGRLVKIEEYTFTEGGKEINRYGVKYKQSGNLSGKPFAIKPVNFKPSVEHKYINLDSSSKSLLEMIKRVKSPPLLDITFEKVYNSYLILFLTYILNEIQESYTIKRDDFCSLYDLIIKKKINSKLMIYFTNKFSEDYYRTDNSTRQTNYATILNRNNNEIQDILRQQLERQQQQLERQQRQQVERQQRQQRQQLERQQRQQAERQSKERIRQAQLELKGYNRRYPRYPPRNYKSPRNVYSRGRRGGSYEIEDIEMEGGFDY
jgi:hypothetical protein